MDVPHLLSQLAAPWAHLYSNTKAVSTAVTYVHFAGLLLGGGAAVAADRETLKAAGEADPIRANHLEFLGSVHSIAITGLAMLALSGVLMFLGDLDTFWGSSVFVTKMCLVGLLLANGALMQRAERLTVTQPGRGWGQLKVTSVASLVLWFVILLVSTVLATSA
jgi:hypothetical protein